MKKLTKTPPWWYSTATIYSPGHGTNVPYLSNNTTNNKKTTMMTPKQKADQLINKFLFVNSESVELVTGEHDLIFSLNKSDAIECALIAVDEIVAEMRDNDLNFQSKTPHGVYAYWVVVKHEIKEQKQ